MQINNEMKFEVIINKNKEKILKIVGFKENEN